MTKTKKKSNKSDSHQHAASHEQLLNPLPSGRQVADLLDEEIDEDQAETAGDDYPPELDVLAGDDADEDFDLPKEFSGPLPLAIHKEAPPLVLLPSYGKPGLKDSLHLYLREINKFAMLHPEEELALARKVYATGDADAAFKLISAHLRLVVKIAMDFQRRWMQNVLDLIQEGNVGLVKAVSKFDPEKGIKFSYYATFWIKAYILKFIMDNWRMVKVGTTQTQRKLFYNLNKERQHLIAQGFEPDAQTLSERLNVSKEQVVEMEQRLDAFDLSLDTPINDNEAGSSTRLDYLPALAPGIEETLNNKEMEHIVRERVSSLIPSLSDKEQYILQNRLLSDEPVTLREIGEHFAITRERVRQIEARLLQKVRDHLFRNISDFSQDWIR